MMVQSREGNPMPVGPNRRAFIAVLGSAAAWPLVERARAQATPVVGFLSNMSPDAQGYASFVGAFRRGLGEAGYVENQNVVIDFRSSNNQIDRLPGLVKAMVQKRSSVIVTAGGNPAIQAAISATSTIPIVALIGSDWGESGLGSILSRPDRNLTGINVFAVQLVPVRLQLMREVVSNRAMIALLANPNSLNSTVDGKEFRGEALHVGQRFIILEAGSEAECDAAFASLAEFKPRALVVESDPLFSGLADRLIALAQRYSVPVIYPRREFVVAGGLMSYGTNISESYYQAGIYSGRILQGTRPADLPVLQATKFELVININAARALSLTVPPTLLARADEVIE
jgi:putative tryptophan/tyrosine transport system substrate-binding protein